MNGYSLENLHVIYGHQCKDTQKWYIGQTNAENPDRRWLSNGQGYLGKRNTLTETEKFTQPKIARAIEKYGWNSFETTIFGYYTLDEIDSAEINKIMELDSYNNGYNSTPGGESLAGSNNPMYGKKVSDKVKQKLSERFSGKNNPRYGKPVSDETKRKISESLKGVVSGEKHPNFGKHLSEETRLKISEKNKGHKLSEETKEKIRESNRTRKREPLSQIAKDKIGDQKRGDNSPVGRHVAKLDLKTGEVLATFSTAVEAGKSVGLVNGSQISATCRGKQKSAGGFGWKYLDS